MDDKGRIRELENKCSGLRKIIDLLMGYVNEDDKGDIIEDLMSELLVYRNESRSRMIDELRKGEL